MAEATGYPALKVDAWYGVLAPKGTPTAIVAKVNNALAQVLQLPQIREQLAAQGLDAKFGSAEQLGALLAEDIGKWARVVKASGATVQ
jgi:tripartite-type tricarboxylate transporter receptor subunit TctC